jgi:hypothetical protein
MLRWPTRRWTRAMGLVGTALAAFAVGTEQAAAQFAPSIPYVPYQRQYMSFSYPTVVNPGMPNQARFNMYGNLAPNPNAFFMPGGDLRAFAPVDPWASGGSTGITSPAGSLALHDEGDTEYRETRELRQQLYEEWQRERDPQRRLELRRQIEEADATLRTLLAAPRRRTGAATPAESGGGTAAGAPALGQNAARRRTGATTQRARPPGPAAGAAAPRNDGTASPATGATPGTGEGAPARPSPGVGPPAAEGATAGSEAFPSLAVPGLGAGGSNAMSDFRRPGEGMDRRHLGPTVPTRPGLGTRGVRRITPRPAPPANETPPAGPGAGTPGR